MTLDSFFGGKEKKTTKKATKKTSGKKTTQEPESEDEVIEEVDEDKIEKSKKEESIDSELEEDMSNSSENSIEKKSQQSVTRSKAPLFISISLLCSSTCGYKKMIKRPKSFIPTEKDLICPKCGKTMKIVK